MKVRDGELGQEGVVEGDRGQGTGDRTLFEGGA